MISNFGEIFLLFKIFTFQRKSPISCWIYRFTWSKFFYVFDRHISRSKTANLFAVYFHIVWPLLNQITLVKTKQKYQTQTFSLRIFLQLTNIGSSICLRNHDDFFLLTSKNICAKLVFSKIGCSLTYSKCQPGVLLCSTHFCG